MLVTKQIIRQDDLSAAVAYLERQSSLDNLMAMDGWSVGLLVLLNRLTLLAACPGLVTRQMIRLDR